MPGRLKRALAATTLVALGCSSGVLEAADASRKRPTISASVIGSWSGTFPPPSPPSGCTWSAFGSDQSAANTYNAINQFTSTVAELAGTRIEITWTYYSENGALRKNDDGTERYWEYGQLSCPADTDQETSVTEWLWRRIWEPDPILVRGVAHDLVIEQIPEPTSAINPPDRAPAQLGLWLATETAGPIVARASIGDFVWSETTAEVDSIEFEMGNGDVVSCDGSGTPIPESQLDSVEPGPCGYVYQRVSDLGEQVITVTVQWKVTWRDSRGRSGDDPTEPSYTAFPYDVYEIQTVGT